MSKYVSWKNSESEDCNTDLSDKFKDLESSNILILHQARIILQNRSSKTEGLQQEFFSPSELSHMIQEKEAAYRPHASSLWVAYGWPTVLHLICRQLQLARAAYLLPFLLLMGRIGNQ